MIWYALCSVCFAFFNIFCRCPYARRVVPTKCLARRDARTSDWNDRKTPPCALCNTGNRNDTRRNTHYYFLDCPDQKRSSARETRARLAELLGARRLPCVSGASLFRASSMSERLRLLLGRNAIFLGRARIESR